MEHFFDEDTMSFSDNLNASGSTKALSKVLLSRPLDYVLYPYNSGSDEPDYQDVTSSGKCDLMYDLAEDLFYGRIWITSLVEFGTITKIETGTIQIWNADFYNDADITVFADPEDQGIAIENVPIPVHLSVNGFVDYTITVAASGPSSQYTTYEFTINGEVYEVLVTGTRSLVFPFEADWSSLPEMSYKYEVGIWTAKNQVEKRRALRYEKMTRGERFRLTLMGFEAHSFLHMIRGSAHRLFVIPIFAEVFQTETALQGTATIAASTDITENFNLNNYCDYIIIIDKNSRVFEVMTIAAIINNVISFTSDIVNDYDNGSTLLYPAFSGMISAVDFGSLTNDVLRSEIEFSEEVFSG
jgi:hypothetical protein